MSSTTRQCRMTGCLLLLPLLAYGAGNLFFEMAQTATVTAKPALLRAGTLLWILNSVTVMTMGIVLYPLLWKYSKTIALAYLSARIIEAVLLLAGLFALQSSIVVAQTAQHASAVYDTGMLVYKYNYQVAMIILGTGSAACCSVLYRQRVIPVYWSVWGMAGYALLAVGAVAEVCGMPIGIYCSVPGGLFELALGIRLLMGGSLRSL